MMLGNLSVKQIEERLGVEFDNSTREWLNEHRQENVSIDLKENSWHCFDAPFTILCDCEETCREIYDILLPYSSKCKCQVSIGC